MNKSQSGNEHSDNMRDDDMAELFDRQVIEVPAALDDKIRAMARAEPAEVVTKHAPGTWASRFAPMVASAAVVFLAVMLVPTIMPGSSQPTHTASIDSVMVADVAKPQLSELEAAETLAQLNVAKQRLEKSSASQAPALEQPVVTASRVTEPVIEAEQLAQSKSIVSGGSTKAEAEEAAVVAQTETADAITEQAKSVAAEVTVAAADSVGSGTDDVVESLSTLTLDLDADTDTKTSLSVARNSELANTTSSFSSSVTSGFNAESSVGSTALRGNAIGISAFRKNQQMWLVEIKRLFKAQKFQTFVDELELFKKRYPKLDLKDRLTKAEFKKLQELRQ